MWMARRGIPPKMLLRSSAIWTNTKAAVTTLKRNHIEQRQFFYIEFLTNGRARQWRVSPIQTFFWRRADLPKNPSRNANDRRILRAIEGEGSAKRVQEFPVSKYYDSILSIGFHMLLEAFGSTGAIVRGEWGSQVRWRCCMSPPLRHSVWRRSQWTILWKTWGILSNGWLVTIGAFPPSINTSWCNGENRSNKSQLWNQWLKLGAIVDSLRQVPNSFSPQRHQSNHTAPRLIVWKTSR
jgi:hypothetical protein